MSIKKLEDGRYEVDVRPQGAEGKRIRRKFDNKAEARTFERYILTNYHNKEWLEKPADKRPLAELIEIWWELIGRTQEHGDKTYGKLKKIDRDMGYPRAYMLTKPFLLKYLSTLLQSDIKASTANRMMTYLAGMFSALISADLYHSENPARQIKPLKEDIPEMVFLSDDEISALLKSLDINGDERRIALLSLCTGVRWKEAFSVKAEHIIDNKVTFYETKNGKKRTVPISQEVKDYIKTKESGRLFESANYNILRMMIKAIKPDMPKGQAVHVLRHTFATHFMINGGNIITLQRILGHSNIHQTMIYAHFAPDHLYEAITLNPLRGMSIT